MQNRVYSTYIPYENNLIFVLIKVMAILQIIGKILNREYTTIFVINHNFIVLKHIQRQTFNKIYIIILLLY